ncbi:MAG: ABC transporter substrate-binding protein [Acidobacteriota bacterium]
MEKHSTRKLALIGAAIIGLALSGCGSDTIQIGAVMPLTGEFQAYGEANRRGIELALDEIQANGYALTLQLDVKDTESDPAKASTLLDEQYAGGAFAALGGTVSMEAEQMIATADKYDRVLLSPSATSAKLAKVSRNFFRIAPSDLTEGNKMADFAYRVLEIKTVAVVAEEQSYAEGTQQAFSDAFTNQGGEVVETIELPPNTTDLEGLMSRVVTLAPDAVYLAGYETGISSMITQLRQLGFEGRILTTHAFATASAIASVGDAAAGVVLTKTVFEPDSDQAHVQKFVNAYREKYGEDPDLFAAEGYDAMHVLAVALEERHTLANDLPRGLRDAVKEYPGVTGSIQFDENNEVRKFPRVYLIGKDLGLYDYSKRIEENQRKMREKQAELQRRLEEIRRNAAKMGNGG